MIAPLSIHQGKAIGAPAFAAIGLLVAVGCRPRSSAESPRTTSASVSEEPRPAVIAAAEGERRLLRGVAPLLIKVDPRNTGSRRMVLGSSDLPPGDGIASHRHQREDEIIVITRGTARVQLGARAYTAGPGGVVFIPEGTCIALTNVGPDTLTNLFVFSAPGFEQVLRDVSSAPGEVPKVLSAAERAAAFHRGHAQASPPDC